MELWGRACYRKRQETPMGSPALWARLLSTSGGGKRGPVALLLPAHGPRSQHRPYAQAKRNRAGREMTHPPLENASSPGSLPQQPSERHWAPKPRAGRAFSQQTPGPLLCPQLPQSSGPPAPPTGSCLSRPKMLQEAGGLPLPQDSPAPLETPSLPPTHHPAPREAPEPFLGVSVQRACSGGRREKGHPRTQLQGGRDSSEGLSPTVPWARSPGWGAAFSTGKQWLWREDSTACLAPGGVRVWPSPPFRHG